MSVALWVELAAAALAIWAAILSMPRPPSLDWQRLFKVTLSTLLRGELEARDGQRADWERLVVAWVPYHPAGRDPERKLSQPDVASLATPALEGERALVEGLARLPDPAARWRLMMADNEQTQDALLSDPEDLGAAYSARAFLGAQADWSGVAAWSEGVQEGLRRRLAHIVLLGVGGDLGTEMASDAGLRGARIGSEDPIEPHLSEGSDRLVLVLEEDAVHAVVQRLHREPGLRDRVMMVLSVGGQIAADAASQEWMQTHFVHDEMDTELNRQTAYAAVQYIDPAAPLARDWAAQRWPIPPDHASGRASILPMDLGPLPEGWRSDALRRQQLGRALWVMIAAWLT